MTARVVYLTVRDPDYETEHVQDVIGDVEIETIDVDLGGCFDGVKYFWRDLGEASGREWLAERRESVAHLDADSAVRERVEELCELIESEHE